MTIDDKVNEILVSYAEEAILIVSDGHILYEEQDAESAALYRNLARAAQAITNLIAQETNKARLDEHERVYNKAIDLEFSAFATWSDDRIAQLTADKEQVQNKTNDGGRE